MDDIKREELEKVCKNYKVWTRMVAVRMARVLNIFVEKAASLQIRCPTWVREWLRRYNDRDFEGIQITATLLKTRKEISLQEQKHQDHAFPQRLAVPERRGGVLALGKAQTAGFRILSDIFGHGQGHLYLLSNGAVPSGIDQLCKQKNRVASRELMTFAIPQSTILKYSSCLWISS